MSENPLSVDESRLEIHLFPAPSVVVPLRNRAKRIMRGTVVLEMLGNQNNGVVAMKKMDFEASPGDTTVSVVWDKEKIPTRNVGLLGAYRVRYTIEPRRTGNFHPLWGIVQLGTHIADGFTIQGFPYGEFPCALDCQFLVRVSNPNNGRGLADYDVKAQFGPDGGPAVKAVTDRDGYATIQHAWSRDVIWSVHPDPAFQIQVERGDFFNGWGGELFFRIPPHMVVTTDKQEYRPGETIHVGLRLVGVDRLPWNNAKVTVRITDLNDDKELASREIVTSHSGDAEMDWSVPADAKNGKFSILAKSNDEPQGNWMAQAKAKVSVERPLQPTFFIHLVPDRTWYLAGQDAEIAVSASDVLGKPLRESTVLVRLPPHYPPREFAGQLDETGKCIMRIPATALLEPFQSGPSSQVPKPRLWKLPLSVEITDKLTGKTGSVQMSLALAPQEIHLQVDKFAQVGSDRTLGIISSYADGSPAAIDGVLEAVLADTNRQCGQSTDLANRKELGRFRTNSYGVGIVTLPQNWISYAYPQREDGPYSWYSDEPRPEALNERASRYACILVRGSDAQGKTATLNREIWVVPEAPLDTRISTDHALYHPGDALVVRVESGKGLEEVAVEIRTARQELLGAQHIHLVNGEAEIRFPYSSRFSGVLVVHVYAVNSRDDHVPFHSWSSEVIYPNGERLEPGDRWPTSAATPDLVEPDHPRSIVFNSEIDPGTIAGVSKANLLALDPRKPFPAGLDLLARVLLGSPQLWGGWWEGYFTFQHEDFDKAVLTNLEAAVRKVYSEKGHPPKDARVLRNWLQEEGINLASVRDGWGMEFRLKIGSAGLYVISNGPDKIPNTRDDYLSEEIRWPATR